MLDQVQPSAMNHPKALLVSNSAPSARGLLLTYQPTSTVALTTTVTATIVGNGYETLRFTSDAANPGCLPLEFLTGNLIGPCEN